MARFVALALVGTLALTACSSPTPTPIRLADGTRAMSATVVRVVDGDTVVLTLPNGRTEHARLLGIDTPETVKPNAPVECFGPEASARTKALLPTGTDVAIARDLEPRDRYGRLLVYLWRRSDGLFVNRSLLEDGYADTLEIEPNTTRRAELRAASAKARSHGAGQWSRCPPRQ